MIHKFWSIRLAASGTDAIERIDSEKDVTEEERTLVRQEEEQMEERVYRIWSIVSAFEESAAACISDMLLHVSNGTYVEGVVVAKKFIWHVDVLFTALDRLEKCVTAHGGLGLYFPA